MLQRKQSAFHLYDAEMTDGVPRLPVVRSLDEFRALVAAYPVVRSVHDHRVATLAFTPVLNAGESPRIGPVHEHILIDAAHVDERVNMATIDAVETNTGVMALFQASRPSVDVIEPDRSAHPGPWPVVVFIHGGGWVTGTTRSYRRLACHVSSHGFLVISVAYRLAPEHPWPLPGEDCVLAVRWAQQHAAQFGGDPLRIALWGDSAGAHLAAMTAQRLSPQDVRCQVLLYGVLDLEALRANETDLTSKPVHEKALEGLRQMRGWLLGPQSWDEGAIAAASPIRFAMDMPPSLLIAAEDDVLTSQSIAFGRALREAGVEHELEVVSSVPHGFMQCDLWPQTREMIDRACRFMASYCD